MVTINPQDVSGNGPTAVAGTNRGFVSQSDALVPVNVQSPGVAWGAIIGGALTAIAILILSSALAYACELSAGHNNNLVNNPNYFGWGAAIWAWVTSAIAFYVGGMIAGAGARGRYSVNGMTQGLLTWSLVLSLALVVSAFAVNAYMMPQGTSFNHANAVTASDPNYQANTAAAWSTFIALAIGMVASLLGGKAGCSRDVARVND